MTTQLTPLPVFRAWDNNGVPLAGGLLFSYIANSTTKQATFTDSTGGTQNPNPVVLNYRGEAQIWLDPTKVYKFVLAPSTDTDPPTNPFWSVDQINGGSASPSFNIIPTVDNLFTLGSTTFSWANVYVGPNHAPILGASGIVGYYPRTAAEIALAVTPTDFSYTADLYVDPRRYGADPTGVADSTGALQIALNVAYQAKGCVWLGNNCKYLTGPLSLTMTGSASQPFRMIGSSVIGSQLLAKPGLAATSLLTFKSSNPTTVLIQAFLKLENFSIFSAAKISGVHGLSILGLATWQISGVRISGFDRGLDIQSSLIGLIDQESEFVQNNYGANIQLSGAYFVGASTTNLIRIFNSRILLNTSFGISYNNGSQLHVRGCSIEGNGTAGDLNTGGVRIQGALSPDALAAGVLLDYNWFEGNLGIGLLVDAPTGGCSTNIAIRGGHVLRQEAGRSITVNGATRLIIDDLAFCDTANLIAGNAEISNSLISVLNDAGITSPTYINVTTSAANYPCGRLDTALLTITGMTAATTQTVKIIQQGDEIRVVFADFLGTSNSTSCTITGLPIKYSPGVTRFVTTAIEDNGVDLAQTMSVAAGGTMTLFKTGVAAGFTAAGSKGLRACDLTWRL